MKTPSMTTNRVLADTAARGLAPEGLRERRLRQLASRPRRGDVREPAPRGAAGPAIENSSPRLRLVLSTSIGTGALDGAWWPRSRNLQTELADLVDNFPATSRRIVHAVYSRPDWRPAHRRIKTKQAVIKVGSFPTDDSHRILLSLSSREILHIMVIPPHSSPALALAIMVTAASPGNRDCAATILHDAQQAEDEDAAARWSDDGGVWEPRLPPRDRHGSWRT